MSSLAWLFALLVLLLSLFGARGPGAASPDGHTGAGSAPAPATVTLADNGRTVTLPVGGHFLLALGEGEWAVHVSDASVVARVPNITVVRGAQGIYVAKRPGRATLAASSQTGTEFHVTIVVT